VPGDPTPHGRASLDLALESLQLANQLQMFHMRTGLSGSSGSDEARLPEATPTWQAYTFSATRPLASATRSPAVTADDYDGAGVASGQAGSGGTAYPEQGVVAGFVRWLGKEAIRGLPVPTPPKVRSASGCGETSSIAADRTLANGTAEPARFESGTTQPSPGDVRDIKAGHDAADCLIWLVNGLPLHERLSALPAAIAALLQFVKPEVSATPTPSRNAGIDERQDLASGGSQDPGEGNDPRATVHGLVVGNTLLRLLEKVPLRTVLDSTCASPAAAPRTRAREGRPEGRAPTASAPDGLGGGADLLHRHHVRPESSRRGDVAVRSAPHVDGDGDVRDRFGETRPLIKAVSCQGAITEAGLYLRGTSAGDAVESSGRPALPAGKLKYCELLWVLLQEVSGGTSSTCPVTWGCLRTWAEGLEGEEALELARVEFRQAQLLGLRLS
jgi:hypothetical protein